MFTNSRNTDETTKKSRKKTAVKGFLETERPLYICNLIAVLVFLVLSFAYRLPLEIPIYTLLLLEIFVIGYEVWRFASYKRKLAYLNVVCQNADTVLGELPEASGGIEEAYIRLAEIIEKKYAGLSFSFKDKEETTKRYLTMWSHQIKTPIAGMHLLLAEEEIDRSAMKRELYRIEQYTESVLQYQRLSSVENDLMITKCSVSRLVREAMKKVSVLLVGKKISVDLSQLYGELYTDEKWFVFILEQLLGNAIKYTDHGKIVVGSIHYDTDSVILVIEDTGIGIRKEDLGRIFEWGFTGANGRTDKKATGLGLALVKQAALLLGCDIEIESTPGTGTRAMIILPAATVTKL